MATSNKNTPGERLKRLIKENGYTQEQFSKIIDMGLTQLKECIGGKKDLVSLPYEVLMKISQKLNVDIGYFIGEIPFKEGRSNSLYGFIKNLSGFEVECNPMNEDQICISYENMRMYTDIVTLEEKVKEALLFQIFLENHK